jgi:hypothetical protein
LINQDTQSNVKIENNLSSSFPIENGLKQGDALSPYAVRNVQGTKLGLDMNGTQQVIGLCG